MREKRHSWMRTVIYTVTRKIFERKTVWERQRKKNEEIVSINRYKYGAIDEIFKLTGLKNADVFWKRYANTLNKICLYLSIQATNYLRTLIATQAYTSVVIDVNTHQPSFDKDEMGHMQFEFDPDNAYTPTGEFVQAWEVIVEFTESLRSLRFNIIYSYNEMSTRPPEYPGYFPTHQSFGGEDYRRVLADILNNSVMYSNGNTRRGRWQEAFDVYCHTKLYAEFINWCRKAKIIS